MNALPGIMVSDLHPVRSAALFFVASGALFIFACFHFTVAWYWCLLGVVAHLLLVGSVSRRFIIDLDARVVHERVLLLVRRVLKSRKFPLSEFNAIIYRYIQNTDESDQVVVGLRHCSGRRLWLRSFAAAGDGRRCSRGAEEFAWRLSCDTGIEIDDHVA